MLPGQDAIEVTDVYLALGVPLNNITGIERDPEIAKRIKEVYPALNLINKDLASYVLDKKSTQFDVVSLDYTGIFKNSDLESAQTIIEKQTKSHYLLHFAHSGRRDGQSQILYKKGLIAEVVHAWVGLSARGRRSYCMKGVGVRRSARRSGWRWGRAPAGWAGGLRGLE